MAGLNYGNSFRQTKDKSEQSVEGVSYGEIIKKWIVRIKINNRLSSNEYELRHIFLICSLLFLNPKNHTFCSFKKWLPKNYFI